MRADETRSLCPEAQAYYYDFLCQDDASVPEAVRRHLATCPACQAEIARLRETLRASQRDTGPAPVRTEETIEVLTRQFQFLDQQVNCSDVKPFLPELARLSSHLRIPTPVTVHVDHCPECAEDLAVLSALNLSTGQLQRLSRFFQSFRGQDAGKVRQAFSKAASCVSAVGGGPALACGDITPDDLFDSIVPEGGASAERRRAVASHLHACPACEERTEMLRRTFQQILERANSQTTTVYHPESEVEDTHALAGDVGRYPIDVQVLHGDPGPETSGSTLSTAWPAGLLTKAAVVALVVAALVMFQRMGTAPVATATNVGDVLNKVLAKVPCFRVHSVSGRGDLIDESWIDYRTKRMVRRDSYEDVLSDLSCGRRQTIDKLTGVRQTRTLNRVAQDQVRRGMIDPLRAVAAQVSSDTKIEAPTGELGAITSENLDVYEAIWTYPRQRSAMRIYIDPATALPQRVEFYSMDLRKDGAGAKSWERVRTTFFEYPAEEELDRQIQALFPPQ